MDANEHGLKLAVTPLFEQLAERSLDYLKAGFPVHYKGPSGVGKTTLALYVAEKLGRPTTVLRGYYHLGKEDLFGDHIGLRSKQVIDNYVHSVLKREDFVKPIWMNSRLVEAVKHGHSVIYDEFTRSSPDTNNLFLSVLEEKIFPLYGSYHKEPYIPVHPNFSMIFTSNPEEYAGVYPAQEALMDRLITLSMDYSDIGSETLIVCRKTGIKHHDAETIVRIASAVRQWCAGRARHIPSLRASLMIATIVRRTGMEVGADDPRFLNLCSDVLQLSISSAMEQPNSADVQAWLADTIRKAKERGDD